LTVEEGNAKDLKLAFSGSTPGDYGTVAVTVGFAERLKRVLTTFTDSLEGPIKTAVDGYNSDIKELRKDIESIQLRLSQRESYLIQQFSKANEALAQMQYLQASLSRQLAGLG
jgi:flagellar hook-associated protein 2